jgi:ABC-2 type transport system ATP-binding protein
MPLIEARALTKRFGTVTALDGLTLDVQPGIIGLVGANGAGKSTFLKILLGLLPPTSGTAQVMDMDVTTRGPQIRQFVGHMGRMAGLPAGASRERTAEVLRHVGLYEERYRPMGGYSTGMKQRVKLAQALVHDPSLLLLDEPTNGLDPAGRDEMLALVKRTGTEFGIATVVASHLLGEIERVCTFLLAIDAGRLLRAAPIASFTERTGTLGVEVEDGADALAARLAAEGLTAKIEGHTVLVDCPDQRPFDLVRDAIDDLGLALIRLEHRRHRLEDLFRAEEPADDAA